MLLYIIAFMLKLPFLARRSKVTPRFLAFVAGFLTLGLLMRKFFDWVLFSEDVQKVIADQGFFSSILRFFLGSDLLKAFWSFVIGFGITAVIIGVPLLLFGYMAGQNMYSQYEQYKGHEWEATQSAISIFLGINRGTWVVSDGKAEVRGESGSSLTRFGGPGILIVQEGHAVILEVSGKLSRTVGRGITWLKPFERISMVVPLNGRAERITVEQVATKDKVLIEEFAVIVFHKVDPGPEEERIQDGQFAYTEQKLLDGVWSPGGADWRNTVKSIADGAVRDVVGRHDLEELMPMSDTNRTAFREDLRQVINKTTFGALGVQTTSVDIGPMKVPDEARKRLMEKWLADWDIKIANSERQATIVRGEADAVLLKVKEVAWAEAQREIIQKVTEAFREVGVTGSGQIGYVVALRTLETLEKMAADPATKILLPNEILSQLTDIHRLMLESTPGGDGREGADARARLALPSR